jgi:hypothetical protein
MSSYLMQEDRQGDEEPPQWARHLENVMREEFQKLGDRLGKEEEAVKEVRVRLRDFEFHTRKYNVIIHGLDTAGKDCEDAVQEFFKTDLKLDAAPFLLAACHPLPSPKTTIVRFVRLRDKDLVMRSLVNLRGKKGLSVRSDLPKELRLVRSDLAKNVANLRKDGYIVRLKERGMQMWIEEKKDGAWIKRV